MNHENYNYAYDCARNKFYYVYEAEKIARCKVFKLDQFKQKKSGGDGYDENEDSEDEKTEKERPAEHVFIKLLNTIASKSYRNSDDPRLKDLKLSSK